MTNNKHLVIVILLILIVILSVTLCTCNRRREQFHQESSGLTVEKCSKSMDELINLIESLKAINFPTELRQAYAMSILTKDPAQAEKVRQMISSMDISDSEKRKLAELIDTEKGIAYSLQDKHAVYDSNNIFKKLDAYENDMLYHTL